MATARSRPPNSSRRQHPPLPRRFLPFRVGHGFDLHRLEPGYPLIIGGINIPHDRGCEAHSDGDVLLHCVVDAILGALGLPDFGQIFPKTDPNSFLGKFWEAWRGKAWEACGSSDSSEPPASESLAIRTPVVGLAGILRKEQELWESTDKSLQDAFQDLNALMV